MKEDWRDVAKGVTLWSSSVPPSPESSGAELGQRPASHCGAVRPDLPKATWRRASSATDLFLAKKPRRRLFDSISTAEALLAMEDQMLGFSRVQSPAARRALDPICSSDGFGKFPEPPRTSFCRSSTCSCSSLPRTRKSSCKERDSRLPWTPNHPNLLPCARGEAPAPWRSEVPEHLLRNKRHGEGAFYSGDWSPIDYKQKMRCLYPWNRSHQEGHSGPLPPQQPCEEAIRRNRCFATSHGSNRMPQGLLMVGKQALVP